MKFIHEQGRIYMNNEAGQLLAETTFPLKEEGVVDINHTFVDETLTGQGVAGKLMEEAYREIKGQNKKAILTCSYAIKWFDGHRNHRDILLKR